MSTININKNVADPFYRYKMPKLIAKIEGRGNGIKTVIVNMTDIAKALHRPPSYPTKYMGIELGAQVILDSKNDRYVVNGSHDVTKVQDVLYDFISNYVLCPQCENPETELLVYVKREKIKIKCIACGYNSFLDRSHRLDVYIIKNPPPPNASGGQYTSSGSCSQPSMAIPKDVVLTASVAEELTTSALSHVPAQCDLDFYTDTSTQAVNERLNLLSLNASLLTTNPDLEKTIEERLNIFYEFTKINLSPSNANTSKILIEAKRLMIIDACSAVIAELLFSDGIILKKLISHKELLMGVTSNNKISQMNLLGGIELIMSKYLETVGPQTTKILKLLYDFDIIEEEVFLEWSLKRSNRFITDINILKRIHELAKPFIDWLKTADVESDPSDTDDEVEFMNYNGEHRSSVTSSYIKASSTTNTTMNKEGDDRNEEIEEELNNIILCLLLHSIYHNLVQELTFRLI